MLVSLAVTKSAMLHRTQWLRQRTATVETTVRTASIVAKIALEWEPYLAPDSLATAHVIAAKMLVLQTVLS